jgi:hypothetical protein
MKILKNIKASIKDGQVTITGQISEYKFDHPVQQVTVGYLNPANMQWPRHCQLSHEAFFVKAFGNGVGIMLDDLVNLAAIIEPKTTFPPKSGSLDQTLTVHIDSELTPELQWEISDDGKEWSAIEGQTTNTLDKSKIEKGKIVRLRASSEAGSAYTNPVMVA